LKVKILKDNPYFSLYNSITNLDLVYKDYKLAKNMKSKLLETLLKEIYLYQWAKKIHKAGRL